MAIDINTLRKFKELWEPVLAAIPAVIELEAQKADMERGMAVAKNDLQKAQEDVAKAHAEAAAIRARAAEEATAATAKRDAVLAETQAARTAATAAARKAEDTAKARLVAITDKVVAQEKALSTLSADYEAKRVALDAEHAARVAAQEKEIAELAKRQRAAERTLSDLKARLG